MDVSSDLDPFLLLNWFFWLRNNALRVYALLWKPHPNHLPQFIQYQWNNFQICYFHKIWSIQFSFSNNVFFFFFSKKLTQNHLWIIEIIYASFIFYHSLNKPFLDRKIFISETLAIVRNQIHHRIQKPIIFIGHWVWEKE